MPDSPLLPPLKSESARESGVRLHPRPNGFDVMKEISRRDGDIQYAPLGNILRMNKVKAGAQITIGVPYEVMIGIIQERYLGGLYVVSREEFARVESELAAMQSREISGGDTDAPTGYSVLGVDV